MVFEFEDLNKLMHYLIVKKKSSDTKIDMRQKRFKIKKNKKLRKISQRKKKKLKRKNRCCKNLKLYNFYLIYHQMHNILKSRV